MPIHDWTRADADDFHHFHQTWIPLLTVASYIGGDLPTAYVESVGVGDCLPSILLFLTEYDFVPSPLEETYHEAWAVFPTMLKEIVEAPV